MNTKAPRVESSTLAWSESDESGVERKSVAIDLLGGYDVELIRLAPGASLPARPGKSIEALVLEGEWTTPDGPLTSGGYLRRPAPLSTDNATEQGCTMFVRTGAFEAEDVMPIHLPASDDAWVPGHGNLRVRPLHSFGAENTALVHWPANERFIPHRHWGGEEIFVLSGTFEDEHGRYPQHTWLLSPHLSNHHPFVGEETIIYVKTGHVRP